MALAVIAAAFLLTATMAWGVIRAKSGPLLSPEDRAPADWPFSFQLPAEFSAPDVDAIPPRDPELIGYDQRRMFRAADGRWLVVAWREATSANLVADAMRELMRSARPMEEFDIEIERALGTRDPNWTLRIRPGGEDGSKYLVGNELPGGRSVLIVYRLRAGIGGRDDRILREVCDSVRVK